MNVNWDQLKKCIKGDYDAFDLIQKFLVLDPKERLTDYDKIKSHPYFADIDFENIKNSEQKYIKGYVKKRIKGFKPQKLDDPNMKKTNEDSNIKHTFCTERVDNLHIINMREWKKKMTIDIENSGISDYLQDFTF
jgi:hypothetical protein